MRFVKWIGLILLGGSLIFEAEASLPGTQRNGVLRTGASLDGLLGADTPESLQGKCTRENAGTRLFSSFCREFIDQLQRKINLMVVETEIRIQAERLAPAPVLADQKTRLDLLIRLNSAALQAEESIRAIKAGYSDRNYKDHLHEILPETKKVRDIYEAYAKLNPDGRS